MLVLTTSGYEYRGVYLRKVTAPNRGWAFILPFSNGKYERHFATNLDQAAQIIDAYRYNA